LESWAKLAGALDESARVEVSVVQAQVQQQTAQLESAILGALARHPAAQRDVLRALEEMTYGQHQAAS
jgi:hypothetical protein